MSSGMARTTIRYILTAVDFLHMEAGIIHTNWVFPFEMIPAQSELNLERMTRSPAKKYSSWYRPRIYTGQMFGSGI